MNIEDDGTMPENVESLRKSVVGHRIISVTEEASEDQYGNRRAYGALTIELDSGRTVRLVDTDDCCAYTELNSFLLNPGAVDHVITGVRADEDYETWTVYAELGDILHLSVGWSPGNPFYYGYGFDIQVADLEEQK